MADDEVTTGDIAQRLKTERLRLPTKFEAVGLLSNAGVMPKLTMVLPFREVAERLTFDRLLDRHDYDAESATTPGQRDLSQAHADKIAKFLQETDRPYLGTLTIAIAPEEVQIEKLQEIGPEVWVASLTIPNTSENPVIEDGQHRVTGLTQAWKVIREDAKKRPDEQQYADVRARLESSSVEVTMLLESDPAVLSTIFVKMASTRPISSSLIAIMDSSAVQNRLGQHVTRKSRFLADRTSYLSAKAARKLATAKGRDYDPLYPAAAVRSAAAAIVGVGVRDRSPDQREGLLTTILEKRAVDEQRPFEQVLEHASAEVAALIDYAAKTLPGWRQLLNGSMSAREFKAEYVHSAAAGLHVIANVIAVARAAGVDAHLTVDGLAQAPWSRHDLRRANRDGEEIQVHELFEGTLVATQFDTKTGQWKAGQGGATRTAYEEAIRNLLQWLAARDPLFVSLTERAVLQQLGLVGNRVGRPRKRA